MHLLGRQNAQQAVASQVAKGKVGDFDRCSGRIIRRLEEREAVVFGTRSLVQPNETATEVPQQGIGSCRSVLRRMNERGPSVRRVGKLRHEHWHTGVLRSECWLLFTS